MYLNVPLAFNALNQLPYRDKIALRKLGDMTVIVDDEYKYWSKTNSIKTVRALYECHKLLVLMTDAIQQENNRTEHILAAVYNADFKRLIRAIRTHQKDQGAIIDNVQEAAEKRNLLKNSINEFLDYIGVLIKQYDDKDMARFAEIKTEQLERWHRVQVYSVNQIDPAVEPTE